MKKLLLILMICPVMGWGQTVYILTNDSKSTDKVKYELLRRGLDVSADIKETDYTIELVLENLKRGRQKGIYRLTDSKTKQVLYETKPDTQGAGTHNNNDISGGVSDVLIRSRDFEKLLDTIPVKQ